VPISAPYSLTDSRRFFAAPATPRQRQYEALRAFYVEELPSAEVAQRFGYSPGAFRVLCHAFRSGALPEFFATAHPGPRGQPKKSRAHEQIVALRKRNYSVYEISQALKKQGTPLSATAVREVLAAEGFAPLPRRLDEERPSASVPTPKPSPMSATLSSTRASSPQRWEGCSCSSPIWCASTAMLWRRAPSCPARA
jgi:transposase